MRDKFVRILLSVLAFTFFISLNETDSAAKQQAANSSRAVSGPAASVTPATENKPASAPAVEDRLKALEQIIERQQREIQALREIVEKRSDNANVGRSQAAPIDAAATEAAQPGAAIAQTPQTPRPTGSQDREQPDAMQKKVDELYKRFGAIRVSGDIRFRGEPFSNQGFDSPAEQPFRGRLRVRARLALDGVLGDNFDWGMRLATNIFTDPISSNQTLTDFFERKPFTLDRAFVRYDSKTDIGVQLVAGKFEPTFRRTQMVWDDDLNVEGASEALYFKSKSPLRQLRLVAFQLPFFESAAAKDGVLYGGQLQTDWQMSKTLSANVNVAYYDWVRPDLVVRNLGAAATQVNGGITGGAGVTGGQNGALGTTNRVIRDAAGNAVGLVAGFNLLDVLGQLTWQAKSRLPVTFTFDFVRNLSSRIDDEQSGYWAGARVGQSREPGDWMFEYTFARIEQDAVLVPFNFSDILASNSRVHMPSVAYQLSNGVTLQWNGLYSQRANKVFPLSPVNRYLIRNQFDVIYKF